MARSAIPDQMHATPLPKGIEQFRQRPTQMLAVILVQATGLHFTAVQNQDRQEVDGLMAHVFKLSPFDLPGVHPPDRTCPFQRLEVGLFVHRNHDFIMRQEPLHPLIQP